jgi:hypothetical protein
LNARPPAPKAGALPGCATPRHVYCSLHLKTLSNQASKFHHVASPNGLNPKMRDSQLTHFAVKGAASINDTKGKASIRVPSDGGGTVEALREHGALSEELGVSRLLLYRWRYQLDPVEGRQEPPPESPRESTLREENHQLNGCWRRRLWRWIFSRAPCKRSRLDARQVRPTYLLPPSS